MEGQGIINSIIWGVLLIINSIIIYYRYDTGEYLGNAIAVGICIEKLLKKDG